MYVNDQWEVGEVYWGRDLVMTQPRRRSLSWHPVLVSSAFHSQPDFGEKPSWK